MPCHVTRVLLTLVAASLSGGAVAPAASSAVAQAAEKDTLAPARFHGEYGLGVHLVDDSVVVRWLTREAGPGSIMVLRDGDIEVEATTAPDTAHRFVFERPGGRQFTLRYGAVGDPSDEHEIVIDTERLRRRRVTWSDADSIFVVSDVHGEFDRLTAVLQNAGLIDANLHWTGGRKHLVVIGDVFDRGADATRALWFLYRLEREAGRRDGHVHILLGNHEIMIMLDDLRYVSAKENEVARRYGVEYSELFHPRTSVIGRWLTTRPAVIRIEDVLFAHGGVSSDYADWEIEEVDDSLARFTGEELFARWNDSTYLAPLDTTGWYQRWDFFWDARSIFWYRGYVRSDSTEAELDTVLTEYRSRLMVVGHTPGPTIRQRFGGKLIAVNALPFASEVLLLVRRDEEWERFRISETGRPVPLGVPGAPRQPSLSRTAPAGSRRNRAP